jgi:hypothetical protein
MKQMNEWISTKDRLPDNEKKKYLCVIKGWSNYSYIQICSFTANLESVDEFDLRGRNYAGWYDYDSEWGYGEMTGVTHWMELPDLPEEDK